MDQGNSVVH